MPNLTLLRCLTTRLAHPLAGLTCQVLDRRTTRQRQHLALTARIRLNSSQHQLGLLTGQLTRFEPGADSAVTGATRQPRTRDSARTASSRVSKGSITPSDIRR